VIVKPTAKLDKRNVEEIVDQLLARRPGYVPEWLPQDKGADVALSWITARYLYSIIQRLNQAPEKNKLGFLDLLGLALVPRKQLAHQLFFSLQPMVQMLRRRPIPNLQPAATWQQGPANL